MTDRIIIVEEGDVFYGTLEQFEDCFGSFDGNEQLMKDWADKDGYSFYVLDGELINFRQLPHGGDKLAILAQITESKGEGT